ncbi:hypothetical protein B0E47_15060 [Rhodanobacter sp. B05]|uniref:CPBP family intramembrane glutamic endopeptidase n=1 Tax=Rhodanobacter sp. B05 TaxID=1945859 RepID=UPI000985FBE3|nr:CPBP family intramembrane glutamic endopeptidase [Rhodanobacter sp. B05]OOG52611.1 hypothetical protein B0E47_15060 [Rhodanobacter sp. B05]
MDVLSIDTRSTPFDTRLPPVLPALVRAPGVWTALGWITLYFVLQLAGGTLAALALAIASGSLHSWQGLLHFDDVLGAMLEQPGMQSLLAILTLAVAAIPILLLTRRRWPRLWPVGRPPGFGFAAPATSRYLLLAVVVGVLATMLGGWLTDWLAHGQTVTQNIEQLGKSTSLGWRIPLALMAVSLGPLVEELLFRGVLLSALLQRWGSATAILLSSLLFALMHLPGLNWQVFAVPNLLLLALALAWLRLRSESIWPSVLAHGTYNLMAVVAWFLAAPLGG